MKPLTAIYLFVIVGLTFLFTSQCIEGRRLKAEIQEQKELMMYNQAEINFIMTKLDGIADDCIVKREPWGFSCREIKSGKVFRVTYE